MVLLRRSLRYFAPRNCRIGPLSLRNRPLLTEDRRTAINMGGRSVGCLAKQEAKRNLSIDDWVYVLTVE